MNYRPSISLTDDDLAIAAGHVINKWKERIFINVPLSYGIAALRQYYTFFLQSQERFFIRIRLFLNGYTIGKRY